MAVASHFDGNDWSLEFVGSESEEVVVYLEWYVLVGIQDHLKYRRIHLIIHVSIKP